MVIEIDSYNKFELLGVENILSEEEVAVFLVLALHRFLNEVVRIIVDNLPEVIYGKHDFSRPPVHYLNFAHIMIVYLKLLQNPAKFIR